MYWLNEFIISDNTNAIIIYLRINAASRNNCASIVRRMLVFILELLAQQSIIYYAIYMKIGLRDVFFVLSSV